MQGLSHKAFVQGWNSILLNLYNTNSSLPEPKIFHAGASHDAEKVLQMLLFGQTRITQLYLAGVSMGANMLLKLLGEWGSEYPDRVGAAAVISPLIDLASSLRVLERLSNKPFQRHFLQKLKRNVKVRVDELNPFVEMEELLRVSTIREFDEMLTAPLSGFPNASVYYEQASALPYLSRIRLPTLVLHSEDDPLLPRDPLTRGEVRSNPFLEIVLTKRGGHVGFLESDSQGDPDRFWAENRVIDFFTLFGS